MGACRIKPKQKPWVAILWILSETEPVGANRGKETFGGQIMEDFDKLEPLSAKISPFHQTSLSPDEVWGSAKTTLCSCGRKVALWSKKCLACNQPVHFKPLLKKRKRIERWIDKKVHRQCISKMSENQLILEKAKKFSKLLAETRNDPFPQKRKKESYKTYFQRLIGFYTSMFKLTSPKKLAFDIPGLARRTSADMTDMYRTQRNKILASMLSGDHTHLFSSNQSDPQSIYIDLMNIYVPYTQALRTLQLGHSRMMASWDSVRHIFERDCSSSVTKALWNKARNLIGVRFKNLEFHTAIWNNAQEKEKLKRFDTQLSTFFDQCGWFQDQTNRLIDCHTKLLNSYRLSMRKHLVLSLVTIIQKTEPAERKNLTRRILSQQSFGSRLGQWLFGNREYF